MVSGYPVNSTQTLGLFVNIARVMKLSSYQPTSVFYCVCSVNVCACVCTALSGIYDNYVTAKWSEAWMYC